MIAGMTISLDGFAAGAAGDVRRLYPDVAEMAAASSSMAATIAATGSVVVDQWTFDMGDADAYVGQYEFQVPILVVTNRPPVRQLKQDEYLTLTFVSDGVGQAIAKAQAAAGAQDVQIVGGPTVIQQALRAGLVDELHLDVMSVLLGEGLRFFDS